MNIVRKDKVKEINLLIDKSKFTPISICIMSLKGGVSKTTIANHLYTGINTYLGKSYPLLLDFDLRNQSNKFNSHRQSVFDFPEINNASFNEVVDEVTPKAIVDLLGNLNEHLIKVFDNSANDSTAARTTAQCSDIIYIPTSDTANDLDITCETLQLLEEIILNNPNLDSSSYTIKVIPARIRAYNGIQKINKLKKIKAYISERLPQFSDDSYYSKAFITDRVAYHDNLITGKCAHEIDPKCEIDVKSLMDEVAELIIDKQ